jgi:hypothetical protein
VFLDSLKPKSKKYFILQKQLIEWRMESDFRELIDAFCEKKLQEFGIEARQETKSSSGKISSNKSTRRTKQSAELNDDEAAEMIKQLKLNISVEEYRERIKQVKTKLKQSNKSKSKKTEESKIDN